MNTMTAVPFFMESITIQAHTLASTNTKASAPNNQYLIAELSWVFEAPVSIEELTTATGFSQASLYQHSNGDLEIRLSNPNTGQGISVTGPEAQKVDQKARQDARLPKEQTNDLHVRQASHYQSCG